MSDYIKDDMIWVGKYKGNIPSDKGKLIFLVQGEVKEYHAYVKKERVEAFKQKHPSAILVGVSQ